MLSALFNFNNALIRPLLLANSFSNSFFDRLSVCTAAFNHPNSLLNPLLQISLVNHPSDPPFSASELHLLLLFLAVVVRFHSNRFLTAFYCLSLA